MIGRLAAVLLVASFVAWPIAARAGEDAEKGEPKAGGKAAASDECAHDFVGVANCKLCHNEADTGAQFAKWQKSPHAQAFKTLSTDKAKEVGKKLGVDNPAKDAKCLKCHVTGFACPPKVKAKVKEADGVGCESCHGAGKDYAKQDTMKSKEASIAKGLVMPTEKVCVKCHNKESPTYKEFNFKEFAAKIAHPNPKLHKE